jgi:hypothetical protein
LKEAPFLDQFLKEFACSRGNERCCSKSGRQYATVVPCFLVE